MAFASTGLPEYVLGSVRVCPSPDCTEVPVRAAHGPGAFLSLTT
jgi:hypothetical protein